GNGCMWRFMIRLYVVMPLLVLTLLAGCESGLDKRYLDASLGQPLELPPDLSASEQETQFQLPSVFSGDDPDARDKVPVLARVESVRLNGRDGFYWLEVDEPVENLYQLVKHFWNVEGYQLVVDEPIIGVMQTEWIYREEGVNRPNTSWWERLFSPDDYSATQDQFRTRIERGQSGQANRIYIAHRGTEYNYVFDTKAADNLRDDFEDVWRYRQPESELEAEMLSRLMIHLGLQQVDVEEQIAEVKLYSPRAFMQIDAEENSPYLILKDTYHIGWNRIYHEVERLNFDIVASEFQAGISQEGAITVSVKVDTDREDGGFLSFFTSSEEKDKNFILVLSEESHELTRVELETDDGEYDTSKEGVEFMNLIYNGVR
ncbi:MAG: outer membrane protein assembly factor BamC, partial [Pseudomonadota bacterium]